MCVSDTRPVVSSAISSSTRRIEASTSRSQSTTRSRRCSGDHALAGHDRQLVVLLIVHDGLHHRSQALDPPHAVDDRARAVDVDLVDVVSPHRGADHPVLCGPRADARGTEGHRPPREPGSYSRPPERNRRTMKTIRRGADTEFDRDTDMPRRHASPPGWVGVEHAVAGPYVRLFDIARVVDTRALDDHSVMPQPFWDYLADEGRAALVGLLDELSDENPTHHGRRRPQDRDRPAD